jgi:hypothetical protein
MTSRLRSPIPLTVALLTGALLTGALALAACGGGDDTTAGTQPGAAPVTDLTVTVDAGGGSSPTTWTLTCDPTGGDHPQAQDACDWLASAAGLDPNPLEPVPGDVACTEIYGGDQTASVTGTLDGEQVSIAFDRTNGCEIARWDAAVPLLVETGGV